MPLFLTRLSSIFLSFSLCNAPHQKQLRHQRILRSYETYDQNPQTKQPVFDPGIQASFQESDQVDPFG